MTTDRHNLILDLWASGMRAEDIAERAETVPKNVWHMVSDARQRGDARAIARKPTSAWSPERDVRMVALWNKGLTAREVSQRLNDGTTRNSVIGRVRRLGLPPREQQTTPRQRDAGREAALRMRPKTVNIPRIRRRRALPGPVAAFLAPEPPQTLQTDVGPLRLPLLALEAHSCRYAVGEKPDARGHGYLFCGNETVNGGAWCIHHRALVFTPAHRKPPSELVTPALQAGDAGGR